MPQAFEKLGKILELEESQGYQARSVIGGFELFSEVWLADALAEVQDEPTRIAVREIALLLSKYEKADADLRVKVIGEILDHLGGGPSAPSAVVTPVPTPRPPTVPPPQKPGSIQPRPDAPSDTPPATEPPEPQGPRPPSGLEAPVSTLPGISTSYAKRLQRLDVSTVGDLLYLFPRRYQDYTTLKPISQLEYGEETTVIGVIWETNSRKSRGGGTVVSSIVADASGTIEAVWFNQPYLVKQLRAGRRIALSGRVDQHLGRLTLQSPEWEPLESELIHTGRLVPIYPLTSGIGARWIRRLMKRVVDHWAPRLRDHLTDEIRERAGLLDLSTAIRQIHFPDTLEMAEKARRRLSFDEFFMIQLGMLNQRRKWKSQEGTSIPRDEAQLGALIESLPFELTGAQRRSLDQVLEDLSRPEPMSRLLQGDVGSGKTIVATAAILMCAAAGKQAALMAPTEILAEQHYRTISEIFVRMPNGPRGRPIEVLLLTGSLRRVQRGQVYAALASGQADIVVGTHALIQRHVTFKDLGLAIIDEQHRFGVAQRAVLRGKGAAPHTLVMSATPIPRSLCLTIYGDLDISVIDELPPGRQPIDTRWLLPRERERAYAFVRSQVDKGHQAFILFPLIEDSERVEARSAVEGYEKLKETVLPDLRLGLLHGKLKTSEKDRVMEAFRDGQIDVLVSTSVIEVGIDVPNATVMLIESADRFGLAQLHQFRGRVGRGSHQSYCLLLSDTASPDDPKTQATWERLRAIEQTQDGFVLAEKDMEIRGPGDFFGVRQSGLPTLRLANLSDVRVLEQARSEAQSVFEKDPQLSLPEYELLREKVERFWHAQGDPS
ncbi:ATP-dependent DNA helicase RecG [Chloroflexota bacterium]